MKKAFASAFLGALALGSAGQAYAGTKALASVPDMRIGHLQASSAGSHLPYRNNDDSLGRDSQGRDSHDARGSDNGKRHGGESDWKSHGC